MLCQFTFKNFKSYRDETTLDMQAADLEEFADSLIVPEDPKLSPLVPLAVLYGPNAGGKSGMIDALSYLISRILQPVKTSTKRNMPFQLGMSYKSDALQPFLFDEDSKNQPTEFELFFNTSQAQYHYQLSLSGEDILSESLYLLRFPSRHRPYVRLFEREGESITLGTALKKVNKENANLRIPFLSFLAISYTIPEIEDAFQWLGNCCYLNFALPESDYQFYEMLNDPEVKSVVLDMLAEMDIPISDYIDNQDKENWRVYTTHLVEGRSYQLDLRDESAGTAKIFSTLVPMIASHERGGLFIADELDAKLHPQLLRYLISLYTDPEKNTKHAQLIFTSHDLSIMNNEVLRRDEIWFAARGKDSGSELWSLADIQDETGERVKNTEAYDKRYLEGRYGADPYLKRIKEWSVANGKESETP